MVEASRRVEELLRAMTLEEKIGQLTMLDASRLVTGAGRSVDMVASVRNGLAGSLFNVVDPAETRSLQRIARTESRLGIPLLLGLDVVHGHRTVFPIPLSEAAAFDPDLWMRTARAAASEAASDGINLTFAPMLDIARDPRWGRIAEGPGEDPLVGQRYAAAKVRGFQASGRFAATGKHFAAYGAVTGGRDYAPVDIPDQVLHEVYLPPFRAAVEAGVACIMTAFTDVGGLPMTAHVALLRGLVRRRWGFDGVIVSDYGAIAELIRHGVAANLAEAAALALRAGVDIDMMSDAYPQGLPVALARGSSRFEDVDDAVRRVLRLKAKLGLFDLETDAREASDPQADGGNRDLAREAARRSIVLLKNEAELLPLGPDLRRIAIIGPLVQSRDDMLGPWSAIGNPDTVVTVVDGLRAARPLADIVTVEAIDIEGRDREGIPAAIEAAASADAIVLCLGEDKSMSGEAASRSDLGLPGSQRELAEAILSCGKPVAAVIMSGRPLSIGWLVERADALLFAGFLGHEAGHALADVLTGRFNPTGRLPVSWPRNVGQVPVHYSQRPGGRPFNPNDHFTSRYLDLPDGPLFPFGAGLSYTRFALTDLRVNATEFGPEETIIVEAGVTNEGSREGEETVFLFAHDPVASTSRPILELKDFTKIRLAPGERGTVRFRLPVEALRYLNADLHPVLEPGGIELWVGGSAARGSLQRLMVEIRAAAAPDV